MRNNSFGFFKIKTAFTLSGWANEPSALPVLASHTLISWSQLPVITAFTSGQNSIHFTALSWWPIGVARRKEKGEVQNSYSKHLTYKKNSVWQAKHDNQLYNEIKTSNKSFVIMQLH